MPVFKLDDMFKVVNNLRGLKFVRNSKVDITIDEDYLYINGYGLPTGVGSTGMVPIIGDNHRISWGYAGGTTGSEGIQGVTGLQGPTGSQGDTGVSIPGYTGFQGVTGFQGPTGFQGDTGVSIPGYTGYPGVTGLIGETGDQGLTGQQGETGREGITAGGVTGMICINIEGDNNGLTGSQYISTGRKGEIVMPYDFILDDWFIFGSVTGSITLYIYKNTYSEFPTFDNPHLVSLGGDDPNLDLEIKNTGDVVGWVGITGNSGDILSYNVQSVTGMQKISFCQKYTIR